MLERNLGARGYEVIRASSVVEAIAVLEQRPVDLVATDLKMAKVSGLDLVRHIRENYRDVEVMMLTGYPSVEVAVQAVKAGAEEFLAKPFTSDRASRRRSIARSRSCMRDGRSSVHPHRHRCCLGSSASRS